MRAGIAVLTLAAAAVLSVPTPEARAQSGPDKEIAELKKRINALEGEVRALKKADLGKGGAAKPEAEGGLSRDCGIKAHQFPADSMGEASLSGWTYFFSQSKYNGNYFQLCLNGNKQQMFNVPGLLVKVLDDEHELILQAVVPESFVDPALLGDSWKLVDGRIEGKKVKVRAAGLYVYRILKTSLRPEAFDAVSTHGIASVDAVARVKADIDPLNTSSVRKVTVYLREAATPEKGVELVSAVLKELPGAAIAEDKHEKALLSFVRKEIAKDGGKKPAADASLTMVVYTAAELAATGKETDTTDNYREVILSLRLSHAFAHSEKLIYCGVSAGLETLSGHVKKGHVPR